MRLALGAVALALVIGAVSKPDVDVYLVGDSTMADKPTPDLNPERGWGQLLPRFFDDRVTIHHPAVNGRSTKSFIDEGKWSSVARSLNTHLSVAGATEVARLVARAVRNGSLPLRQFVRGVETTANPSPVGDSAPTSACPPNA